MEAVCFICESKNSLGSKKVKRNRLVILYIQLHRAAITYVMIGCVRAHSDSSSEFILMAMCLLSTADVTAPAPIAECLLCSQKLVLVA